MLELKTPREIAAMDVTGTFVAELLDDLARRARPGVNLLDLEDRARALNAAPSRATGTTRRRSGAGRSATSYACRSTTQCCTGFRTTMR